MKKIIYTLLVSATFLQCTKKDNPFLIQKTQIGSFQKEFTVKQIDSVFANDSIVKHVAGDEFIGNVSDIEIYQKGGEHLLTLSPTEAFDDNSKINFIRINSKRYATAQKTGLSSTFKDFKDKYTISKVDRILNSITVTFQDQNFYITISVDELSSEYKYNYNAVITAASIPSTAKVKSLQLDWF